MSTVSIVGLGPIQVSNTEYTSPTVLNAYSQLIASLQTIYLKRQDNPAYANNPNLLSGNDYDQVVSDIQGLLNLAQNGKTDTVNGQQIQSTITSTMAYQINNILQLLKASGITPSSSLAIPDSEKITQLQEWQSLAGIVGDQIIQQAANTAASQVFDPKTGQVVAVPASRTLQSMVELEYIKTGNQIIFDDLSNLEQAANISQSILDSLKIVQNISNQIIAPSPSGFNLSQIATDDPDAYTAAYKRLASAHFFAWQKPIPIPTDTSGSELLAVKAALSSQLALLIKNTPQTPNGGTTMAIIANQQTLASTLILVIRDISTAFKNVNLNDPTAVKSAVAKWIMDGQDQPINATTGIQSNVGQIQSHIASAIRTGETLNEGQRENVRRYLYVFQEFYKSASAMLVLLGQILDKIGGNVGGLK